MRNVTKEEIIGALDFASLVEKLREAFQGNYTVPMRHHHDFENPYEDRESTLLLMPAWEAGKHVGVKIVTVSPNNGKYDLPAIQGTYMLLDAKIGSPIALMEAKTLTTKRTAAASALASSYASRKDSKKLLMVGTGALAPELIQAHATVRPIEEVLIWGRSVEKAQALVDSLNLEGVKFSAVENLEEAVKSVDIISCATLSREPIVLGEWLQPGQHLDLVGAYRPDMRETDDDSIRKASVFVDTYAGATKECGDIAIPLAEGVLKSDEIKGDLFELCKGEREGRTAEDEITMFKSVGHALEDLAAAQLVSERVLETVEEA
ncbi:ornithine cyclodeaminase family protein [Aureibacter tunicatorum]|uniref:Ornithine cyclodeaminase n=1 Tax=Aureibacter tunicatorum TaxID=866807 RepID=A0AAE4BRI0_9BACT|nr:ornithine cyclodeaminase family protein [Aureibacter tunicatorum]MDR6237820.1 ornithine cyclodeaminase [Aureibacter tunicatorum]BDD02855.1 ornithine cyclodeaminase [Aureibacter tunicatorum]